jgi:hypothetical protein
MCFLCVGERFHPTLQKRPLPLEAEFWNSNTALPSEMRDAIALFERELATRNVKGRDGGLERG